MPRRKRGGYLTYPIVPWWRDKLRDWLRDNGWSESRLAREVGCNPSSINLILNGQTEESSWVEPIVKITGMPLPTMALTPTVQEVAKVLEQLAAISPEILADEEARFRRLVEELQKRHK